MYRGSGLGKSSVSTGSVVSGAASGASTGAVMGPWGAAIGAVAGGAMGAISGGGAPSGPGINELWMAARANNLSRKEDVAAASFDAAQTERGKVIKYALWGTGGLLLAGAVTLWILSRRKGK